MKSQKQLKPLKLKYSKSDQKQFLLSPSIDFNTETTDRYSSLKHDLTQQKANNNNKTDRYNFNIPPIYSSMQGMPSTGRNDLLQQKFGSTTSKKSEKINFYRHENIYSLKDYSSITSYMLFNNKLSQKEKIKHLLMQKFKLKVHQFMMKARYGKQTNASQSRDLKKFMMEVRQQKQHTGEEQAALDLDHGGLSFLNDETIIQGQMQQDLSRSMINLEQNRFNFQKLKREEAAQINNLSISIYFNKPNNMSSNIKGNGGVGSGEGGRRGSTSRRGQNDSNSKSQTTGMMKKKVDHDKLQNFLLKKFEPFLNNDNIDYDQKMIKIQEEYAKLLENIQSKSFYVKIPSTLSPNMQNYNDYYQHQQPFNSNNSNIIRENEDSRAEEDLGDNLNDKKLTEEELMQAVMQEAKIDLQEDNEGQQDQDQNEQQNEDQLQHSAIKESENKNDEYGWRSERQEGEDEYNLYQQQMKLNQNEYNMIDKPGEATNKRKKQDQAKDQQEEGDDELFPSKKKKKDKNKQQDNPQHDGNHMQKQKSEKFKQDQILQQQTKAEQNKQKKKNQVVINQNQQQKQKKQSSSDDEDDNQPIKSNYGGYKSFNNNSSINQNQQANNNSENSSQQLQQLANINNSSIAQQQTIQQIQQQPSKNQPQQPKTYKIVQGVQQTTTTSAQSQNQQGKLQQSKQNEEINNEQQEQIAQISEEPQQTIQETIEEQQPQQEKIQEQQQILEQVQTAENRQATNQQQLDNNQQQLQQEEKDGNKQDTNNNNNPSTQKQFSHFQEKSLASNFLEMNEDNANKKKPRAQQQKVAEDTLNDSNKISQKTEKQIDNLIKIEVQSEQQPQVQQQDEINQNNISKANENVEAQQNQNSKQFEGSRKEDKKKKTQYMYNESNQQLEKMTQQQQELIQQKKLGTKLLDDLLETDNIYDFDIYKYKKKRWLPDVPSTINFKNEGDKAVFKEMFVWQYELEEELNETTNQDNKNTNKKDESIESEESSEQSEEEKSKDEGKDSSKHGSHTSKGEKKDKKQKGGLPSSFKKKTQNDSISSGSEY